MLSRGDQGSLSQQMKSIQQLNEELQHLNEPPQLGGLDAKALLLLQRSFLHFEKQHELRIIEERYQASLLL